MNMLFLHQMKKHWGNTAFAEWPQISSTHFRETSSMPEDKPEDVVFKGIGAVFGRCIWRTQLLVENEHSASRREVQYLSPCASLAVPHK
jgi:hypothetical protein